MNELYLTLRGFKFNNKHNHDMGAVMHSKSIQNPSKKKIKQSVPFMNGSYDFSTVGSNGEINYNEREITIILGLPANNKEQLQVLYSKVLEWLVDVGQSQLIFDGIQDYYFMAEVEDVSTFEEVMSFGQLTVKFIAEPFKMGVNYVGDDTWDLFNFEEDKIQDVEFDVVVGSTISIFNPGRAIAPLVNTNAHIHAELDGYTASFMSGDHKDYGFKLQPGDNTINITTGAGHIKFIFRKETL